MSDIPKILWINWFQGWDAAPALVQACRDSWIARNPGWDIRLLSNDTIADYIDLAAVFPSVDGKWLPPQAYSNLLRVALLSRYGGVWADATVWSARPLDEWLPDATPSGFFAFANPGPDRMLASWFLAATPAHPLVDEMIARCESFWSGRASWGEYHWFHYEFGAGYLAGGNIRATWDETPKIPAGPTNRLQHLMGDTLSDELRAALAGSDQPVFKFDFRYTPPSAVPGAARTLFEEIVGFSVGSASAVPASVPPVPPGVLPPAPMPTFAPPSATPTRLTVVLGMHRSGTSALAEALGAAGLRLTPSTHLNAAATTNERGHFEDLRVVAVNDWILEQHGARWDSPWGLRGAIPTERELDRVREVWRELVADGVTVIKDPRVNLTLPWWRTVWLESGAVVSFVHILRHPTQVAGSLASRDGIDTVYGELLWNEYVERAEAELAEVESAVVRIWHDDLLRRPVEVIAQLTAELLPGGDAARMAIAAASVDRSLQHQFSEIPPTLWRTRALWALLRGAPAAAVEQSAPVASSAVIKQSGTVEQSATGTHGSNALPESLRSADDTALVTLLGSLIASGEQSSRVIADLKNQADRAVGFEEELRRVHAAYAVSHAELDRVHAAQATTHAELDRVHAAYAALRTELDR